MSGQLTETERRNRLERVAAVIGRRCMPWTLHYRPYVQWPADYSENEKKMFREAASEVIEELTEQESSRG